MGFADLHLHTIFSYDGTASVQAVLGRAKAIGLDVIAITDHDEIRGALLAEQLAPKYGIQVIPGVEIKTKEGDLLALGIRRLVPAGSSLIDTLLKVGDQGGVCIVPHLMAGGIGMKSLSYTAARRATRHKDASRVLAGVETYNATALDRSSGLFADLFASRSGLARIGNSDAHFLDAIGLGMTEFPGKSIEDLFAAMRAGTTMARKNGYCSIPRIMGIWVAEYLKSAPARLVPAYLQ
jgi:hypothetical protein